MKKSAKPIIAYSFFTLVLITFLTLGYVSIKLRCEKISGEKVNAGENLALKENRNINLIAEYQEYMSEENIVSIAQSELGMIKRNEPRIVISVKKADINRINKYITEKYDK